MSNIYFGSNRIVGGSSEYTPLTISIVRASDFPSELTINDNVVGFADNCFKGCANISAFNIPDSVTSFGTHCFDGCTALTSITVPSSITSLPTYCFYNCNHMTSASLPSTLTAIGSNCFYGCSLLSNISIPNSVTSLGTDCFYGCSSLNNITLSTGLTNLPSECFYNCSSLSTIAIPSSVLSIGDSCFQSCSALTAINIPNSVTSLGYGCFSSCTSLESVVLANSVTQLGSACFNNCTSLKSVTLSTSLSSLIDNCFKGCSALETITLPSSIGSLNNYAFRDCSSLESLTIPATLSSIGQQCFLNDKNLTYLIINSSPSINSSAFSGCSGLATIYFAGNPPSSVASNAFSGLTFTAYYNSSNSAWTAAIRSATYGGAANVTWLDQSQRPILQAYTKYVKASKIAASDGIIDISTRENHGTASGGVALTSVAFFGKCLSFDGVDDKITFNKNSFTSAFNALSGLTVGFKMRPVVVSGTNTVLFEGFYNNATSVFAVRITNGKLVYAVRRNTSDAWTTYTSTASITAGSDYAVVIVFDYASAKIRLYINNSLDSEKSTGQGAGTLQVIPAFCYVGASSEANRNFKGYIKDILIYNKALNASEVSAISQLAGSGDTAPVLPENSIEPVTVQGSPAMMMEHGSIKKIVVGDQTGRRLKLFDLDGTRSSGIYTDFDYTTTNIDYTCGLAEDNDGYIYTTGSNTGYIVKFQVCSRQNGGQTEFYLQHIASLKLGSLVAANQVTYCAARNAMVVVGWESGGGTSRCYQVPCDLSSYTLLATWSLPSLAGCFDLSGTKLFVDLYGGAYNFAVFQYSSVSDTAEKTSYTVISKPSSYSSAISVCSDSRYVISASDGYMYFQMLDGSLYKYDTNGNYISTVGNIGSALGTNTIRSDCVITYNSTHNAIFYSQADGSIACIYL